mmetsp:Transcript_24928/g.44163  ORF Transcript_24928/g.44163 Transcript_24928/m.44163 type:complete len:109 (+) Transcript_24928:684-1010(+)
MIIRHKNKKIRFRARSAIQRKLHSGRIKLDNVDRFWYRIGLRSTLFGQKREIFRRERKVAVLFLRNTLFRCRTRQLPEQVSRPGTHYSTLFLSLCQCSFWSRRRDESS